MALRTVLLLCHLWMAWAKHHGSSNIFGFDFGSGTLKFPKMPKMPGFSNSKGHSMMTPFDMFNQAFSSQGKSKKSSFGLPNLPSLPGNGKNGQSSSGDMLGTMCGMMRMPFVCDSKSQGINTAECRKNPAACCGKSVRKCSTTDPFTFTSPCGAVSQGAKCVGSVMTSFQKVGVCMCQGGTTCTGSGSQAKCSAGSLNKRTFSILYEDDIEAEPELNPSGFLAFATLLTSMMLLTSLVVRSWRARGQPQLLSQDVEAEALD